MKTFSIVMLSLCMGASFWLPTVLFLPPTTTERNWLILASLVSPVTLLMVCSLAFWRSRGRRGGPSLCLVALVGVWLSGPWFMAIAAAIRTPSIVHDFITPVGFLYLLVLSIFPPYTIYASAMQGSAYALILATILLLVCRRKYESDRWLIPPSWKRFLQLHRNNPT